MAAVVELIPATRVEGAEWYQDLESVVDVSGYTEAAIMIQVLAINRVASTTSICIDTAIDLRSDQFRQLLLKTYAADPADYPDITYFYCAGSSTGSSTAPGFARYLRVRVVQNAAANVTLAIKALVKP